MAENTAIEWCDHTFNPWVGCTKVSPGCVHCYAERREDLRLHRVQWGARQPRHRTKTWGEPVRWNKAHGEFFAQHGRRQRVFCASLADVFDNEVDPAWRADLFALIYATPYLDWLLLTKRVGNVPSMLVGPGMPGRMPWHAWLGATLVNREEMLRDGPKLKSVNATVRFWSVEPMLGDLGEIPREMLPDWVIAGGESGPEARPMHPAWARSLRDQCVAAGVPFLFKQWGEWTDERHARLDQPIASRLRKHVSRLAFDGTVHPMRGPGPESYAGIYRVGKNAAGRLLDGVEHNGFPEASHG